MFQQTLFLWILNRCKDVSQAPQKASLKMKYLPITTLLNHVFATADDTAVKEGQVM